MNRFEKYGHIPLYDEVRWSGGTHVLTRRCGLGTTVEFVFHLIYFSYLRSTDCAHMLWSFTNNLCTIGTKYSYPLWSVSPQGAAPLLDGASLTITLFGIGGLSTLLPRNVSYLATPVLTRHPVRVQRHVDAPPRVERNIWSQ